MSINSEYRLPVIVACIMTTIILVGCAGKKVDAPFEAEKHLVAAGFNFKVAEDEEMLTKMSNLPQHTLLRHERNGKLIWIYPDVAGCKCIYAGDESAYNRLQEVIKYEKKAARLHRGSGSDTGTRNQAAMDVLDIDDGMLPGI